MNSLWKDLRKGSWNCKPWYKQGYTIDIQHLNFSTWTYMYFILLTPYRSLSNCHTLLMGWGRGSWQDPNCWPRWMWWSIARRSCRSSSRRRCLEEPSPGILAIPLCLQTVGRSGEPRWRQWECDSFIHIIAYISLVRSNSNFHSLPWSSNSFQYITLDSIECIN